MFLFRLRTLLIVMVVVPPILAAGWLQIARHVLRQKNMYPYDEGVQLLVVCGLILVAVGLIVAEVRHKLKSKDATPEST